MEDEKIKNVELDDKDNSSIDNKKAKNTEPIRKNSSSVDNKKANNSTKSTNPNTSSTQNNIALTNQDISLEGNSKVSNTELINENTSPISNEKDNNTVPTNNEGASLTDNIRFVINKGDSCRKIANNLFQKGIIKSKEEFTKKVLERNLQDRFQPGNFELRADMDYDTIISILTSK